MDRLLHAPSWRPTARVVLVLVLVVVIEWLGALLGLPGLGGVWRG